MTTKFGPANFTEVPECLICGSTESFTEVMIPKTGEVKTVEEWYELRDRRTDKLQGYQCQKCWDRD